MGYGEEILPFESGETLSQVTQRSCGCTILGNVQGQAGGPLDQTGLVESVSAHGRGWDWMSFKVPSNLNHCRIL